MDLTIAGIVWNAKTRRLFFKIDLEAVAKTKHFKQVKDIEELIATLNEIKEALHELKTKRSHRSKNKVFYKS